jgi:hypothetical protein
MPKVQVRDGNVTKEYEYFEGTDAAGVGVVHVGAIDPRGVRRAVGTLVLDPTRERVVSSVGADPPFYRWESILPLVAAELYPEKDAPPDSE